jgi:nicotinamidase-related amidase
MAGMPAALLVIDVQESFRARPDWERVDNPGIGEQVDRLVAAARRRGDVVFWILHAEPGTGSVFDPELGHVRVFDELSPAPGEPRIVKTSANAFTTTNLQQQLVQAGIRDVVICGIRTEQCCETTTRVACDLGFDVTFVTDATTTSGMDGLSAREIIVRTEQVLSGREFATILTTDEFVFAAHLDAVPEPMRR